ncbi:MAG: GAF domain-containing protein [Spirochaetes bacterium]|nr:GAF domain-containing protein [Spirochaetota bacterium]MBU1079178.1 GAF domain-containing protein [Spirochaetota bacterium]
MIPDEGLDSDCREPTDRLAIVLEATADLNEMLAEPDKLYASIFERLQVAVPYVSGSLQLLEGGSLRIVAFRGRLDPSLVMGLRFAVDPDYPNYQVLESRTAVSVPDVRVSYPHFWTRKDEYGSGHIRSWLGVPLVASGAAIGIIALDRDLVDPFGEDEIRIVRAFADHAAVAVRNARVYGDLQDALAARDALMRETNHRVKNNLQLVTSLIDIHAQNVGDPATRQCLEELKVRIHTVSSIHERLYKREDTFGIELDGYLRGLVQDVFASFRRPGAAIAMRVDMEAMHADPSVAVTIGLIAGELLMNALKYAFPGGARGTISAGLRRLGAYGHLTIGDDGVGMAPDSRNGGFGLLLVRSLAEQVGGEARLESGPGGSSWTVRFPVG